jgi:hypothetical protein
MGKYKKEKSTTHKCKDTRNNYNHCNIDGHIDENCWKLHREINLKNYKIDKKKSNLLATYLSNHVESSSDVNGNIFGTYV